MQYKLLATGKAFLLDKISEYFIRKIKITKAQEKLIQKLLTFLLCSVEHFQPSAKKISSKKKAHRKSSLLIFKQIEK